MKKEEVKKTKLVQVTVSGRWVAIFGDHGCLDYNLDWDVLLNKINEPCVMTADHCELLDRMHDWDCWAGRMLDSGVPEKVLDWVMQCVHELIDPASELDEMETTSWRHGVTVTCHVVDEAVLSRKMERAIKACGGKKMLARLPYKTVGR